MFDGETHIAATVDLLPAAEKMENWVALWDDTANFEEIKNEGTTLMHMPAATVLQTRILYPRMCFKPQSAFNGEAWHDNLPEMVLVQLHEQPLAKRCRRLS